LLCPRGMDKRVVHMESILRFLSKEKQASSIISNSQRGRIKHELTV
jgi:hypothetical protein